MERNGFKYIEEFDNVDYFYNIDEDKNTEHFCAFGIVDCGSKSQSTVKQTNNTNIITNAQTDILNKSVQETITSVLINQASSCGAGISQQQDINMKGFVISGPGSNVTTNQNQSANLNFSCVSAQTAQAPINNAVLSEYANSLNNTFTSSVLAEMAAKAASSSKTNFMAGSSKSSSNTDTTNNYTAKTNIDNNIQNVIINAINNNINMESTQSCISSIISNQNANFTDFQVLSGGSLNVGQTQAASLISKCDLTQSSVSNTTNDILNQLGVQQTNDVASSSSTTMQSSATSEAISTGPLEGIASVFNSIGTMFSGIFGALLGPYISPISVICICCICCILCIVAGGIGSGMLGDDNGVNNDNEFDMNNLKIPNMNNLKIPNMNNLKIPNMNNLKIPNMSNLKIPKLRK